MQRVATDWLAWELTHSALWVSVIAFCNLAPSVVISPLAGAVADRDRPRAADRGLAVRRRGAGGNPGGADPDRADPGRVHRRARRAQRHGRDIRPAGAPMPDPRPGAARLPARRGRAELADLQHRPLRRPRAVRPDDRRLGRGAADRLQRRGLSVRQPDHVPAAARSGDPARPPLQPQRPARRGRGHSLRRAPPRHRADACCSPRRSGCCCARCRRCCRPTSPTCSAATHADWPRSPARWASPRWSAARWWPSAAGSAG